MTVKVKIKLFYLCFMCVLAFLPCQRVLAADMYSTVYAEVAANNGDAEQADWITQAIFYASDLYSVDPLLLTAVMEQESRFHIDSRSSAGAVGLMQLMPDTAASLGVDPYNPLENVVGGAAYLRSLLDGFSSWGEYGVTDAVAGYNAGGQAIINHGGVPMYRETVNYVKSINDIYTRLLACCDA
jgi:soluble lytic murein transglycosylase-like protein